jgi:two-component system, NarL family, nitrate/nitrite response regulator NarL
VTTPTQIITIAVYDQNPMLALGICSLLEKRPGVRAVPFLLNTVNDMTLCAQFEVAIIDPSQTQICPAELAKGLRAQLGAAKLIGYFGDVSIAAARACISTGFRGFLPKTAEFNALQTAIATVNGGALYIDATFADLLYEPPTVPTNVRLQDLTDREAYVLKSVARGKSLKEIGLELELSSKTIETYKARGSTKLNLQGRREIVEYAIRSGWVQ